MPTSSPRRTIEGDYVEEATPQQACARCGNRFRVIALRRADARNALRPLVNFCASCLALMLEVATGYGFIGQLAHWDNFSANAAALAEESHKSQRAKRRAQENAAVKARRQRQEI